MCSLSLWKKGSFELEVVHKWRHTIFELFWIPSPPFVTLFVLSLNTVVAKSLTPVPLKAWRKVWSSSVANTSFTKRSCKIKSNKKNWVTSYMDNLKGKLKWKKTIASLFLVFLPIEIVYDETNLWIVCFWDDGLM